MAERFDLVIVGMGSGGLVATEFALGLGIKVGVVERHRVGGNRLWTGCVPSKAVIASARVAHTMRHADRVGLEPVDPEVDTAIIWERLRSIRDGLAATDDDPGRLADMGAEIIRGTARLTGPESVQVTAEDRTSRELEARFILLCTGARPISPDIDGLTDAGYLTSESVFELAAAPKSVVMIGGGPVNVELAQAFNRLGVQTTLVQSGPRILPRDEPELVECLQQVMREEGVRLHLEVDITRVSSDGLGKTVHGSQQGQDVTWTAEELMVSVGRRAEVEGLGLDEVGVKVGAAGIEVDDRLRSSVPTIYAAGDVAGRYHFTHSAGYEAVRAVRDMFFPGWGKATESVPWCTFTDPELAHAGMTIAEAEARFGDDVQVWKQDLCHSDRARADATTDGAIVVITHKNRVVGGHVLAPAAGEIIHELALAIREGVTFSSLGGLIHVYPTLSTGIMQLAGEAVFEKAESFRWLVKKKGKRHSGLVASSEN